MPHTIHANATLTPAGRLALARCVVEDDWPLRRAAERFQASHTTTRRWAQRYRTHGENGMVDAPSRPARSPRRTPTRRERRVIKLRCNRRWGPARIAGHLGMHPSTVHRILVKEWAYDHPYRSETQKREAFPGWLHHYNHHRFHTALGGPPASRATNLSGQYT